MKFAVATTVALAGLAKVAEASWAITGVQTGVDSSSGARPFRLPITELQTSGAMWDLYVQALQFWQSIDQDNMFSWYQIGGVHGLPNIAWNGANGNAYNVGYCHHVSVLFPTWHRPYMALYEQIISIYAHEIASSYPADKKDEYTKAADQLRMPYWDWSTNATIPDIMFDEKITINAAWGKQEMDNPLFRYNFHPYTASVMDNIYSSVNYTIRGATDQVQQDRPSVANQQMMQNQQQFHDGMYQLFSSQSNYQLFSNTGANGNSGGYQSLENLHNIVHNSIGGDMAYLWIAGQDPIFFLHHANVDRLFAIWQAIYPNSWVGSQANTMGTYDLAPNTVENEKTNLTPFTSDSKGTYFTSDTVRNIKSFGYAYREVVDWNVTAAQLTTNAKTAVNKIYNPNGSKAAAKKRAAEKRTTYKRDEITPKSATAADQQYVLNIVVDHSKINGSMTMNFQLNNQSIGSYAINMMGGSQNSPNMTSMANMTVGGQLSLTHALMSAGANLADTNGTLSSIAKGMSWTGQYLSGATVDPSHLQDGAIKIEVNQRPVEQTDPDNEFPNYGNWTQMAASQLGTFAQNVLGVSESTVKSVEDGIESALEGIL